VKDLITYIPFRLLAGIFGLFPERAMRWIGETAGAIAFRRTGGGAPLLHSHMRRVLGPGATDEEVRSGVRGMYRSYGRYWAETFWFRPRRRRFILDNTEWIDFEPVYRSMEAKRGRIFALPHIGNWEVAGIIAEEIGTPVVAVAEHLSNQRITDWFFRVRRAFGIEIVLTSDPSRTKKLVRILRSGGAVALVADRDVTGRGVDVTFFGENTTMPSGPVALADLTGSDLIPVGAYFKDGRGHRIVVHEPVELPSKTDIPDRDERISASVQMFAKHLEGIIREAPDQWHLFQPNWPSDASIAGDAE